MEHTKCRIRPNHWPYCFVIMLIAVCIPSYVMAQVAHHVTVGTQETYSVMANDTFVVDVEEGRSYCCQISPYEHGLYTTVASNVGLSATVTTPSAGSLTGELIGDLTPKVTVPTAISAVQDALRIAFTSTESGNHILSLDRGRTDAGRTPARFVCVETTLYGGFNTYDDFNFLEVRNVSTAEINFVVRALDFGGTEVFTTATSVQPNLRRDISLHDPIGSDNFGTVILTHDGPPGALRARVSRYAGTVTDFTLTDSVPLDPRYSGRGMGDRVH